MRTVRAGFLTALAAACAVLVVACCHGPGIADDRVEELRSPLTKLAMAAEAEETHFPDPSLTDNQFLQRAEPEAYTWFADYTLKMLRNNGHVIVLVCDKAQSRALLEDAGCTSGMELPHFLDPAPIPCEFTLTVLEACDSAKGGAAR